MNLSDLYGLAERIGGAGALMLLLALVAQHRGLWYSAQTVHQLNARLDERAAQLVAKDAELSRLRSELADAREQHGGEIELWEQRTFNALGVADRLSRLSEDQLLRTTTSAPPRRSATTRRTPG